MSLSRSFCCIRKGRRREVRPKKLPSLSKEGCPLLGGVVTALGLFNIEKLLGSITTLVSRSGCHPSLKKEGSLKRKRLSLKFAASVIISPVLLLNLVATPRS